MKPSDLYVLSLSQTLERHVAAGEDGPVRPSSRVYLRSPAKFRPSQCTPLFLSAFTRRGASCCIHTHSPWAVLVTLILEQQAAAGGGSSKEFCINNIEQIKGFARGYPHGEAGNLGYHDTLRIPVIENTAHEEDLTEFMEEAMERYPDAYAVLVRRHGVYVWGDSVEHAKGQCERYVFGLVSPVISLRGGGCMFHSSAPVIQARDANLSARPQPGLPLPDRCRDEEAGHTVDLGHRADVAHQVPEGPVAWWGGGSGVLRTGEMKKHDLTTWKPRGLALSQQRLQRANGYFVSPGLIAYITICHFKPHIQTSQNINPSSRPFYVHYYPLISGPNCCLVVP